MCQYTVTEVLEADRNITSSTELFCGRYVVKASRQKKLTIFTVDSNQNTPQVRLMYSEF